MHNTVTCTLADEYAQYSRGVAYTNWHHWLAAEPAAASTAGASAAIVCTKCAYGAKAKFELYYLK